MTKVNYRSDFNFLLDATSADGTPIGFPSWAWRLVIYAKNDRRRTFEASSDGEQCINCFNDDGRIHIVCDSHGLGSGELFGEFYADIPNAIYLDGKELTVTPFALGITLVPTAGDEASEIDVTVVIPYATVTAYEMARAEGYEGTAQQYLAALVALPAAVADAQAAAVAEEGRAVAEAERVAAEEGRAAAEAERVAAEAERVAAEAERVAVETERTEAEAARVQAEGLRANAESARAQAEKERRLSEAARSQAETARVGAEDSRALAEASRALAEADRAEAWNTLSAEAEAKIAATAEALEAVEPFAAAVAQTDKLARDLAQYDDEAPIELVVEQSGKCIDTGGAVVNKSGYGVSGKVRLRKGYVYLYRTADGSAIDTGVALCARLTSEPIPVVIDYIYEYDEQGRIVTATAMYDATKVYTYAYDASGVATITDAAGEVIDELPTYRVVGANEYAPMFTALSDSVPHSGYYAVVCNDDCEAVWSAPTPLQQVLVVSYGVIRSIANSKADRAVVDEMRGDVDVNTAAIEAAEEQRWHDICDMAENQYSSKTSGMYYLAKAGTEINGRITRRDTWVFGSKSYNNALEIAFIAGSVKMAENSILDFTSLRRFNFDFRTDNIEKIKGCLTKTMIKRFVERDLDFSALTTAGGFFGGSQALEHFDVSGWSTPKLVAIANILADSPMLEYASLEGWDVRRVTSLWNVIGSCTRLRHLCLLGWDLRSVPSSNSSSYYLNYAIMLEYIELSPCYFSSQRVVPEFARAQRLGIVNGESNGWLEMLAATAPTIRLADDWNQEAWDADPLEENEETPTLLTEEDGVWYINDGIGRTIQLHNNLKSKDWAQEPIALLQSKGYTIA